MATTNPNISPELYKVKSLWATHVCTLAKNNLVRAKKVATGTLENSITYTIDPQTGDINFSFEEYGEYVQSGRRPGAKMPPVQKILKWAKVKGLKGRDKRGRFIKDMSLAWAIATAIKKHGIKKYPFFEMAIAQATQQLYSELEDAIVADLEANIDIDLR